MQFLLCCHTSDLCSACHTQGKEGLKAVNKSMAFRFPGQLQLWLLTPGGLLPGACWPRKELVDASFDDTVASHYLRTGCCKVAFRARGSLCCEIRDWNRYAAPHPETRVLSWCACVCMCVCLTCVRTWVLSVYWGMPEWKFQLKDISGLSNMAMAFLNQESAVSLIPPTGDGLGGHAAFLKLPCVSLEI